MSKDTLKDLKARRSIRSYKADQITNEELDAILEAGTYAASGMGEQSAVLVSVQDKAVIAQLEKLNADVLKDPSAKPFYGAPTVINVLVDKKGVTPKEDGVLAIGNLLNAAAALGVGSCWINRAKEVFDTDEGKALIGKWGLKGDYEGIAHVILGYVAGDVPKAAPRKAGNVVKVK
ncbi:diguanylate cyclase [Spirochaetia bacterium]|nr:diguanylate cyclase [Spirochaetia bacterium]